MRRGTTLVEVLMALLVMGIGISALATLFPISILRTVRATQLTNATVHFRNIESMLDSRWPHLLHDPDGNADYYTVLANNAGVLEHYDTVYAVDPLGWWTYTGSASEAQFADTFGNDGTNPTGIERFNGGQTVTFQSSADFTTNPPTPPTPRPFIDSLDAAYRLVSLPDSWVDVIEGVPVGPPPYTVGVELDVAPNFDPSSEHRAILFDASGGSLVRTITGLIGNTVIWSEDANQNGSLDTEDGNSNGTLDPGEDANGNGVLDIEDANGNGLIDDYALPTDFIMERVRIEARDWRYTWLITVRKDAEGVAYPDIVIFFRRGFDPEDELVYGARIEVAQPPGPTNPPVLNGWDGAPGDKGYDDDGDGTVDNPEERGSPGTDDTRTAYLYWSGTTPALKRGAFLFDMAGRWYPISDFREANASDPAPPAGMSQSVVLLGGDIAEDSTAGAMVPKGVIEVFSITPRELLSQHRVR